MISSFRKELSRNESGQAIILGAVSLIVLAVAIMSTAQLGWAIKERIQLQHAADNAAYTTATMVSRSLNFISWTNRAMISQYVSAMSFQSLVTFLDIQLVMLAQMVASLLTMGFVFGVAGRALQVSIIFSWLSPPFIAASKAMATIGDKLRDHLLSNLKKGIDGLDKIVADIVYGISILNAINYRGMQLFVAKGYLQGYFGAEMIGSIASLLGLGSGGSGGFYDSAIEGTSAGANADMPAYKTLASALGSGWLDKSFLGKIFIGFNSLFDENSKKVGTGNSDAKKLEVLMTEMVNATRTGTGSVDFDTYRLGGLGGMVGSLVGKPGDGNHGDTLFNLLVKILPKTHGGTLMTNADGNVNAVGYLGADSEVSYENFLGKKNDSNYGNHVFYGKGASKNPYQSPGEALLSADAIPGVTSVLPGVLKHLMDFFSNAGEFFPISKAVGIQAVGDQKPPSFLNLILSSGAQSYLKGKTERSGHCRYEDVGIDIKNLDCSMLTKNAYKDYDECMKECKGCTVENENGECIERPTMENGSPYMTCDQCPKKLQQAIEAKDKCDKGMEAGGNAAEQALRALFNGIPASVKIECEKEMDKGNVRHRFWGVTPYVSFDAVGYNERQKDPYQEEYPSFWGFAHKESQFMPEGGALGFGGKFAGENKKFEMSSIGTVEGVTATDPGKCDLGEGKEAMKCSTDGYNYNYMSNGEVEFIGKGMHAWARSQVYYHRPGAWAEPPNMFNPYWKPKLSPIAPILSNQTNRLGSIPLIGGFLKKITGEIVKTVISH